jgi:diguanylate cyclase (GGDEF)-like protein
LKKILSLKYEFTADESIKAFRYKMLSIIALIFSFSSLAFAFFQHIGIHPMGELMKNLQIFVSVTAFGSFLLIKNFRKSYYIVLYTLILLAFLLFAIAFFVVEENSYRATWFIILILGVYVLHSLRVALSIALISILFIISSVYFFDININRISLSTIITTIVIATVILFYYAKRLHEYEEELLKKNRTLDNLATYDSLTTVLNRRAFLEMSHKYLHKAKRDEKIFYFLMIDVDNFKSINDNYGHAWGDKVLIEIALLMYSLLRTDDMIGRLGGEEFGISFIGDSSDTAYKIAQKVQRRIKEHKLSYDGITLSVTVSIGIASSQASSDLERIMHHADQAMYLAKQSGRDCIKDESNIDINLI